MSKKHVDIILPVYGREDLTKICINSIRAHTDPNEICYRILLIDDKPDDRNSFFDDSETHPDLVYLPNKANLGWCKNLNKGLSISEAPYVVFLNNDTIVSDGWLQKMIETMDSRSDIAIVGPVSNNVAGQQQIKYNGKTLVQRDVPFLIGFCMLCKREALDAMKEIDGYHIDERFGVGGSEEIDLCMRLRMRGFSLAIDRRVYVHHFCHQSLMQITNDLDAFHAEKHQILVNKWGQTIIDQMFTESFVPKVLIGISSIGEDVAGLFLQSCLQQNITNAVVSWERKTRMMPDMARNQLAEMAVLYGFDYVLFLDDDMVMDNQNIIQDMINTAVTGDLDILGAVAHTRLKPYFPCVFEDSGKWYEHIDVFGKGVVEVAALGGSCLLVNTRVFKKMKAPWFEFFPVQLLGEVERNKYGEDVYFCRKAREAGFKIHCHGDIMLWHIGLKHLVNRDTWLAYKDETSSQVMQRIKVAI